LTETVISKLQKQSRLGSQMHAFTLQVRVTGNSMTSAIRVDEH